MLTNHPAHDPQDEVLKKYCAEAEGLIRKATSAAEARLLGEQVCNRFQQECSSKLVISATRQYVEGIIASMFRRQL